MNLTKLFNKNYLKENIKKSRGFIALFLILVPVFSALVIILGYSNDYTKIEVLNKGEICWVNLIGMYIIPFVLSFSLFGYVYKRNSVDFINSMPLDRKTIFVTNTIGGIILITIMQLITAIILIACSVFLNKVIIFSGLIWDVFLLLWTSYIFVFVATNLAMTISGTFLTQVAITLLILFLIPFCIDGFYKFDIGRDYTFESGNEEFTNYATEIEVIYSMPYRIFHMLLTGRITDEDLYSTNCIIRMVVLSVVYFAIGMYLFENRKMENTEESFSSLWMHLFVKALTIVPMIIILNLMRADFTFCVFAVTVIAVYYFIFDFLVKRKVKLIVSIPSFIITLVIIQMICSGGELLNSVFYKRYLNKKEIDSYAIVNCYSYNNALRDYGNNSFTEWRYFIKDEKIFDMIFDSANEVEKRNRKYKAGNTYETNEEDDYWKNTSNIKVILKTKYGKKIEVNFSVFADDLNKIIEELQNDDGYWNEKKNRVLEKGQMSVGENICNDTLKEELEKEIENKMNDMDIKSGEYFEYNDEPKICKYYYKNHKLTTITLPSNITKKSLELVSEELNRDAVDIITEALNKENTSYVNYRSFYIYNYYPDLESYSDYNTTKYFSEKNNKILSFILENKDIKFNPDENYYLIRGSIDSNSIYFYTNNVDKVKELAEEDTTSNKYDAEYNEKYQIQVY